MSIKNKLRKEYIAKRKSLSACDAASKSNVISERLFSTAEYKNARAVFTYIGVKDEVATAMVVEKALCDGKLVAAPVVISKGRMCFIRINSLDGLVESSLGVLEPVWDEKALCVCDKYTLVVVPGVVFDMNGCRIGYGGGFYDRFLSENKRLAAVGLAYELQLIDSFPCESHDIAVDMVISEKNIYRV